MLNYSVAELRFIRNVLKPYILLREFLLMKLLLSRYWQVPRQNKSVRLLYIFPKKTHGKVLNLITSEKRIYTKKNIHWIRILNFSLHLMMKEMVMK